MRQTLYPPAHIQPVMPPPIKYVNLQTFSQNYKLAPESKKLINYMTGSQPQVNKISSSYDSLKITPTRSYAAITSGDKSQPSTSTSKLRDKSQSIALNLPASENAHQKVASSKPCTITSNSVPPKKIPAIKPPLNIPKPIVNRPSPKQMPIAVTQPQQAIIDISQSPDQSDYNTLSADKRKFVDSLFDSEEEPEVTISKIDRMPVPVANMDCDESGKSLRDCDKWRLPIIPIRYNNTEFYALIDTGASCSIIDYDLVKRFGIPITKRHISMSSCNKQKVYCPGSVDVTIEVGPCSFYTQFLVMDQCANQVIIGVDFIKNRQLNLYMSQNIVFFEDFPQHPIPIMTSDPVYKVNTISYTYKKIKSTFAIYCDRPSDEPSGMEHRVCSLQCRQDTPQYLQENQIPLESESAKFSFVANVYSYEVQSVLQNVDLAIKASFERPEWMVEKYPLFGNDFNTLVRDRYFHQLTEEHIVETDLKVLSNPIPDDDGYCSLSDHESEMDSESEQSSDEESSCNKKYNVRDSSHKLKTKCKNKRKSQIEDVTNVNTDDNSNVGELPNKNILTAEEIRLLNKSKLDISSDFPEADSFRDIISSYQDVLFNGIGQCKPDIHQFSLKLKPGAKVVKHLPLRMPPEKRKALRLQVEEHIRFGRIRPSRSEWASKAFLVSKKGITDINDYRMVVDYGPVNDATEDYNFPPPDSNSIIASFHQAQYFTGIDLKSSFHQIPTADDSMKYTAFCTPDGVFEWTVMPMGIKQGSSELQALMNTVFADIMGINVWCYIDDIIIFSDTIEDHRKHVIEVLERLRQAGLTATGAKCHFGYGEIDFLGYKITREGVTTQQSKIDSIVALKDNPPKTYKQLKMANGLFNFYGRFIENYAELMLPLTDLEKDKKNFHWTPEAQNAFEKIIQTFIEAPKLLAQPDYSKPFHVFSDASDKAIGGYITQDPKGQSKIIAYHSKKLSDVQTRWTTMEKECYALVNLLHKYHYILEGYKILIHTDNKCLTWIKSMPNPPQKIERWKLFLNKFSYEIDHIPGKENVMADFLSRYPYEEQVDDEIEIFNLQTDYKPLEKRHLPFDCTTEYGEVDPEMCVAMKLDLPGDRKERLELLRKHQQDDPKIKDIYDQLKDKNKDLKYIDYVIENDLVNRVFYNSNAKDVALRIYLPYDLLKAVIQEYHCDANHPGVAKTTAILSDRFYSPKLQQTVENCLRNCKSCQLVKANYSLAPGQMYPRRMPSHKLQVWGMDFMGPYTRTKNRNSNILVLVEQATKFTIIVPLANRKARNLIATLEKFLVAPFGIPKYIWSDNAQEFVSKAMEYFFEKHHIEHKLVALYHPQANFVERVNRDIKAQLRIHRRNFKTDWDTKLHHMAFIHNVLPSATTGYSPYELMFGISPRLPHDAKWFPQDCTSLPVILKGNTQKIIAENQAAQDIYKLAQLRSLEQQDKMAAYYNKNHKLVEYKIGDIVKVKTHILSNKAKEIVSSMEPYWKGPYIILEKSNATVYKVRDKSLPNARIEKYHIKDIARYYDENDESDEEIDTEDVELNPLENNLENLKDYLLDEPTPQHRNRRDSDASIASEDDNMERNPGASEQAVAQRTRSKTKNKPEIQEEISTIRYAHLDQHQIKQTRLYYTCVPYYKKEHTYWHCEQCAEIFTDLIDQNPESKDLVFLHCNECAQVYHSLVQNVFSLPQHTNQDQEIFSLCETCRCSFQHLYYVFMQNLDEGNNEKIDLHNEIPYVIELNTDNFYETNHDAYPIIQIDSATSPNFNQINNLQIEQLETLNIRYPSCMHDNLERTLETVEKTLNSTQSNNVNNINLRQIDTYKYHEIQFYKKNNNYWNCLECANQFAEITDDDEGDKEFLMLHCDECSRNYHKLFDNTTMIPKNYYDKITLCDVCTKSFKHIHAVFLDFKKQNIHRKINLQAEVQFLIELDNTKLTDLWKSKSPQVSVEHIIDNVNIQQTLDTCQVDKNLQENTKQLATYHVRYPFMQADIFRKNGSSTRTHKSYKTLNSTTNKVSTLEKQYEIPKRQTKTQLDLKAVGESYLRSTGSSLGANLTKTIKCSVCYRSEIRSPFDRYFLCDLCQEVTRFEAPAADTTFGEEIVTRRIIENQGKIENLLKYKTHLVNVTQRSSNTFECNKSYSQMISRYERPMQKLYECKCGVEIKMSIKNNTQLAKPQIRIQCACKKNTDISIVNQQKTFDRDHLCSFQRGMIYHRDLSRQQQAYDPIVLTSQYFNNLDATSDAPFAALQADQNAGESNRNPGAEQHSFAVNKLYSTGNKRQKSQQENFEPIANVYDFSNSNRHYQYVNHNNENPYRIKPPINKKVTFLDSHSDTSHQINRQTLTNANARCHPSDQTSKLTKSKNLPQSLELGETLCTNDNDSSLEDILVISTNENSNLKTKNSNLSQFQIEVPPTPVPTYNTFSPFKQVTNYFAQKFTKSSKQKVTHPFVKPDSP
jgi:RNase H-like domain found in reverse transcriptase/Reverse transcriptase (RNA-dependent DNA polymerase)/Integrase zinc binding domain/Integrase core domain/Aspartyl protease